MPELRLVFLFYANSSHRCVVHQTPGREKRESRSVSCNRIIVSQIGMMVGAVSGVGACVISNLYSKHSKTAMPPNANLLPLIHRIFSFWFHNNCFFRSSLYKAPYAYPLLVFGLTGNRARPLSGCVVHTGCRHPLSLKFRADRRSRAKFFTHIPLPQFGSEI